MKRFYIVCSFLFLLILIPGVHAFAEETANVLSFEELKIQVMPEFAYHPEDQEKERPTLLVGYHATFMNKSDQPQKGQITIPLPMKEKNFRIGYVADYNADGTEMLEIEYEIDHQANVLTWETHEQIQPGALYKFVIEYYTDSVVAKEENKSFDFAFTSFADIGLVSVTFLEPLKTESFSIKPEAETHQQNPYGMNMFMYQYQSMKANEKRTFAVNYSRAETTPTFEMINEMAGQTTKATTVRENKTMPIKEIVGIVIGASLFFGSILVWFLKKGKRSPKGSTRNIHPQEEKMTRLRKMLLEGTITEEEYNELRKKMGA